MPGRVHPRPPLLGHGTPPKIKNVQKSSNFFSFVFKSIHNFTMASPASIYAGVKVDAKSPKSRAMSKRSKRTKCLITVKAKKNYEALKTGIRHFLTTEPAASAFASAFALALNEATACEMEDSVEEAEKLSRKEAAAAAEAAAAPAVTA